MPSPGFVMLTWTGQLSKGVIDETLVTIRQSVMGASASRQNDCPYRPHLVFGSPVFSIGDLYILVGYLNLSKSPYKCKFKHPKEDCNNQTCTSKRCPKRHRRSALQIWRKMQKKRKQ